MSHGMPSSMQRMFVTHALPDAAAYALPFAVHLRGALDIDRLRLALETTIARYEALAHTYVLHGDCIVLGALASNRLAEITAASDDVDTWAAARSRALVSRPFRLADEGAVRMEIAHFAQDSHVLLLVVHHVAWDSRSADIFLRHLMSSYGGSVAMPAAVPPSRLDWLANEERRWLASTDAVAQREWWRQRLAAHPPATGLPPEHRRHRQGRGYRATATFEPALSTALRRCAIDKAVSSFALLVSIVAAWIGRRSGKGRVIVGVPATLRDASSDETIGCFVTTLPVCVAVGMPGDVSQGTHEAILDALDHRRLPFDEVVRMAREAHGDAPLYDVLCAYDGPGTASPIVPDLDVRAIDLTGASAQADLSVRFADSDRGVTLIVDVDTAVFSPRTAHAFVAELYTTVIAAMAHRHPDAAGPVGAARAPDTSLPTMISRVCDAHPCAIALRHGNDEITYAQLKASIERTAGALAAFGVGVGDLVATLLPRSPDSIIACLGAWRTGAAFLPLDPNASIERTRRMLESTTPKALVGHVSAELPAMWAERAVSLEGEHLAAPAAAAPLPGSLAYVLFTSGSTGSPKAVAVSHGAIANRIAWMKDAMQLHPGEVVLHKSPLVFDVSLQEYLWPLASGAVCTILPPGHERDATYLVEAIQRTGAIACHMVPDLLQDVADTHGEGIPSLRWLICSGDVLAPHLAARVAANSPLALVNLYGPTETAIDVSWYLCDGEGDASSVPIGRPVDGVTLSIRDDRQQCLPTGARGELCIGGAQVGLGYLGQPRETAARFVPDPDAEPGARLYRTGDVASVGGDGVFAFHGRSDRQVKIAGQRIELAEVEHALLACSGVRHAVADVVVRGEEKILAAWLVADGMPETLALVRSRLRSLLPPAAIPSRLVPMTALPVTPSGKIDRSALQVIESCADDALPPMLVRDDPAPSAPLLERITRLWRDVLDVAEVDADANFFALGGDSLRGLQAAARGRRQSILFTLPMLIAHPTPRELALVATWIPLETEDVAAEFDDIPLGEAQRRFFSIDHGCPHHWNLETVARLAAAPPSNWLVEAASSLARAHDALRLRFIPTEGRWRQLLGLPAPIPVDIVDLESADSAADASMLCAVVAEAHTSLNLSDGPVARIVLARYVATGGACLVLVVHHLVADAVSMSLLMNDLLQAAFNGTSIPRQPSVVRWLNETATTRWPRLPPSGLPPGIGVDFPRFRNRVRDIASLEQSIPGEACARLHALEHASHRLDVLVAALGRSLCVVMRDEACVIDVELHGRDGHRDEMTAVGWYSQFIAVVVRGGDGQVPAASVRDAREGLAAGYRGDGEVDVLFNFFGSAVHAPTVGKVESIRPGMLAAPRAPNTVRSHLLEIEAWLSQDSLQVRWSYGGDVHRRETVEALAQAFAQQIAPLCEVAPGHHAPAIDPTIRLKDDELQAILKRFESMEENDGR